MAFAFKLGDSTPTFDKKCGYGTIPYPLRLFIVSS